MSPRLYDELVPWYHLLDPTAEHVDEVQSFTQSLLRACPQANTLLELGSGAGNNAFHLKQRFRCTLSDVSETMLDRSRALNPDCEHVAGDMRALRLHRTFDAVLVHDAIVYMTSREALQAAIETAFVHTRPGGAAIFAPDCVRETFADHTEFFEGDDGRRGLRCMEWSWDPDPGDELCTVDYAFLLRDGNEVRAVHDRHIEGLFARQVWLDAFAAAGFIPELVSRPIGDGAFDEVFLCRRP